MFWFNFELIFVQCAQCVCFHYWICIWNRNYYVCTLVIYFACLPICSFLIQFYSIYLSISILFWFFFSLFFRFLRLRCSTRREIALRFLAVAVRRVYRSLRNFGSNWIRFQQSSTWLGHLTANTKRASQWESARERLCVCELKKINFCLQRCRRREVTVPEQRGVQTYTERERERHERAQASQPNNSRREQACVRGNAAVKQRLSFT